MFESAESLCNIPRSGSRGVANLPQKSEVFILPDSEAKRNYSASQLVRQLPRRELAKGFESRHGHSKCKRRSEMKLKGLSAIAHTGNLRVAVFSMEKAVQYRRI
jgi:hypothetical protein